MSYLNYTALLIASLLLFSGCSENDFSEIHDIDALRVLAIRTDLPEAHPGDTVNIDHLMGTLSGENIEYHQIWTVCDPGPLGESQVGAAVCSNNPSMESMLMIPVIDQATTQFLIPDETLSMFNLESKYLYILHGLCIDTEANCTALVEGMIEKGEIDFSKINLSVKRIRVIKSGETITNTNPQLNKIYLDDEEIENSNPLQLEPGKYALKASIPESSFEKRPNPEGDLVDERITFYWYSNGIDFTGSTLANQERGETLDDFDKVKFELTGEETYPIDLHVVVVDDRGGVNWRSFTIEKK